MTDEPASLCESCAFMRPVRGRRGQRYLLCENETVEAKYPQQPVRACHGYSPPAAEAAGVTEPRPAR